MRGLESSLGVPVTALQNCEDAECMVCIVSLSLFLAALLKSLYVTLVLCQDVWRRKVPYQPLQSPTCHLCGNWYFGNSLWISNHWFYVWPTQLYVLCPSRSVSLRF